MTQQTGWRVVDRYGSFEGDADILESRVADIIVINI